MLSTRRKRIFKAFADAVETYANGLEIYFSEQSAFAVPSSKQQGIVIYPVQDSLVRREKFGEIRALQVSVAYFERLGKFQLYENVAIEIYRLARSETVRALTLDQVEQEGRWEIIEPDLHVMITTYRFLYLDPVSRDVAWQS